MQALAQWMIASQAVQIGYLVVLLAAMVLPMIGLSIWYHGGIGRTAGGRRLMAEQNSRDARPQAHMTRGRQRAAMRAGKELHKAGELHGAIMSGAYGSDAKRRQIVVYKVCAVWLAVLAGLGASPFLAVWLAGV